MRDGATIRSFDEINGSDDSIPGQSGLNLLDLLPSSALNTKAAEKSGAPNKGGDPVNEPPRNSNGDPITERPGRTENAARELRPAIVSDSPTPAPSIHAPELAGDRQVQVREQNGIRTWTFESGATIRQHTEGPMSGAQVLQDQDGRVIRMLGPTNSSAAGRPRQEIDMRYNPGDANTPAQTVAVIRNAQTGQVLHRLESDESTTISLSANSLRVEIHQGFSAGVTEHFLSGLTTQSRTQGRSNETRSVALEDSMTEDAITIPRGSNVRTLADPVGNWLSVTQPNGQTDTYSGAVNSPRSWESSSFQTPRNLEYNVNGQNQSFPNITSARLSGGEIHLTDQIGRWTLTIQNQAITGAQYRPFKEK